MSQEVKVSVKNLYKIFGPHPKKALGMLEQGLDKEQIFEKTETTIGVQNASFEIYNGEIFVIMGLSGSGKSTMVRMINRLIEPTVGQVFIDGEDIVSMTNDELVKMRRKKMSMVFQSFALMPHMTVLQNAAFGLEMDGIDKQTREARALQALEQVGLEAWAGSMPDELSGGMQQRVGLARGLAVDPDILLMDEAFSALDPLIRTEMQDELLKLQAKAKRTIVFTTSMKRCESVIGSPSWKVAVWFRSAPLKKFSRTRLMITCAPSSVVLTRPTSLLLETSLPTLRSPYPLRTARTRGQRYKD
jgi:glycine betaine/proline transport system ATP-binding protein